MATPRAFSIPVLLLAVAAAHAAPDSRTAAELNEKGVQFAQNGRLEDAVKAFREALAAAPDDAVIKKNLGRCEANWGVELLAKGDAQSAEQATRRARDLLPEDPTIRLNLASCLEDRGYPVRAAVEVRKALELGPGLAKAHDRMANVLYREGHLDESAAEWETAAKLDPKDVGIAERLARAKASLAAEAKLTRQTSAHFEILFDMEHDAVLASKVLQSMEEAHGVVGTDLQHFGQERLVVVLIPSDEFQAVTGTHGWVAGLYDGRIRLPVKGASQRESELVARARHEYVHSVLSPLGNRAPGWLHEGLAQVYEGRSAAQALRRVAASPPVAFETIAQSFASTKSAARANLQYDTALAFVAWLRDGVRGSAFRLAMASLFADGPLEISFKDAYEKKLADLYGEFQASVPR